MKTNNAAMKIDSSPSAIAETKKEITSFKKSQGIGTNGKGSCPRSCFSQAFRDNYDAIFKKKTRLTGGRRK
jgi:hypothetical protein